MRITGPRGHEITSVDTWRDAMPPRVRAHWTAGRSARELANARFRTGLPAMPEEMGRLLDSREETRGFVVEEVRPERVTALDAFRGGHRNHDAVLYGRAAGGDVVVAVEAKADESLGPTLAEQVADLPEGSNRLERRDRLVRAVFATGEPPGVEALRYQLFTGAVGAVLEAREAGAAIAVLAIQVFTPAAPSPGSSKRRAVNHDDVTRFLETLGHDPADGALAGPVTITDGTPTVPLFIGSVQSPIAG